MAVQDVGINGAIVVMQRGRITAGRSANALLRFISF
jgi:hypothetical protein